MSKQFALKRSASDVFSPVKNSTKDDIKTDTGNYDKMFRKNPKPLELIVNQTTNKKTERQNPTYQDTKIKQLCEDIQHLRNKLDNANKNLEDTRKCYRIVIFEMVKQLEAANQRELKRQTRNLVLQLEKEKLKYLLESKTNLMTKLRRELLDMRRTIKSVNKGIRCVTGVDRGEQLDSGYNEFLNDLNSVSQKCNNIGDDNLTNETAVFTDT